MGIKESITNLRKALRTTQTNAPAVIDTLIRGLDGVETAAEEENTYSTDERIVGKWIDGSDVYEKVINVETITLVEGRMDILHGITNLGNVIALDTIMKDSSTDRPIPYTYSNGTSIISVYVSATNITIVSTTSISGNAAVITIRYTKAAATRSPEENDTKNDGDEEKKDNER